MYLGLSPDVFEPAFTGLKPGASTRAGREDYTIHE
jgi:hypothetical protein